MKNMRTLSHYGHEGVELFVTYGYGLWPYAVFANQIALLGPASDPARVREGGLAGQGRLARASPHAGSAGRARSVGRRVPAVGRSAVHAVEAAGAVEARGAD